MNQRYAGFIYRGTNLTAYESYQLDQRIRASELALDNGRFQWPWNEEDDDDDTEECQ